MFEHSNKAYPRFDGFMHRRLLVPRHGGRYAAVVELPLRPRAAVSWGLGSTGLSGSGSLPFMGKSNTGADIDDRIGRHYVRAGR